jgi:DNA-binding NtrC family response regulator
MRKKGQQSDCPILIVDDEVHALKSFELTLRSHGLTQIIKCAKSTEVMGILTEDEIELILLDILMPELSGEELLESIVAQFPEVPVLMVTGLNEVETAVRCMQKGAFDYVLKPVEKERLISSIQRAIELRRLRRENAKLTKHFFSETVEQPEKFNRIITRNRKMFAIFKYCEAIGGGGHPILITGETGVGKELMAEAIHGISGRSQKMVAVNVAGFDENIFSDTLFGHIKGAFTGATSIRSGYIEKAAGGSLFLDEIGDLSLTSQVKLLRLLDKHEYFPLGSDMARTADVRFIFATHKDLTALVKEGSFRKDLYFRLHTHHIHIPPLRERIDDLPLLLNHFIRMAAEEFKKDAPTYGTGLIQRLKHYPFPGNVRELKSMVIDAIGRNNSKTLLAHLFTRATRNGPQDLERTVGPGMDEKKGHWLSRLTRLPTLKELTSAVIEEALHRSKNNQRQAAHILGITPQALNQRLKRFSDSAD